ncbi:MAG: hypothetical protein K2L03_01345, partial [Bacteroidales bacterium]|nr:hypothetical protein [Bacteroidales bacterium]
MASVGNRALQAEGVPPVIKYQAVLRDLEGEPMVDRTDLAIRITLRQGSPAGTILYQETHTDLTTDAFGLLLLEIGRGQASGAGAASLSDVPWENSPIYAQVEIQADDNGYTMMGASELLSVPYALYAGNASVGYGLTDGFLPKYDAGYMNLVDSKVSETYDGQLQFYTGDEAYKFPTARGNRNQTLVLIDDEGTLGWRAGGGGGGGAGCEDCHDGFMTYWDEMAGQLHTTDMRYDEPTGAVYAGSQFISPELMIVENEMEINGTVSGNHNLQYKDLPYNQVWVGNKLNQSEAYRLGGDGVTIDSLNKVLRFGGGASVWGFQPDGTTDYVYTKLNDGQFVRVGIGLERPKTRLHVQDGALLLSGTPGDDQDAPGDWEAGHHLYWHAGKGALRMGKLEAGSLSLWNTANLGENSIALGTGAQATAPDNVAIGKKTEAQGENAMVFGQNSVANDEQGLALGHNLFVSGMRAVGIGHGSSPNLGAATFKAVGARSVSMGYNVVNAGDDAVAIGTELEVSDKAGGSVVLGSGHEIEGENSVAIGSDIKGKRPSVYQSSDRNFQIGMDLKVINGSSDVISIGQ